jgi:hypothetical protein
MFSAYFIILSLFAACFGNLVLTSSESFRPIYKLKFFMYGDCIEDETFCALK